MKDTINTILASSPGLENMPLRLAAGVIFFAHGGQKLFGWFGGYGLEGTGAWMASIGIEPSVLMAALAGSAEFFGGIALILGFLIRPAALLLASTMIVAILTVHVENGLFMANNGYEFGLVLLAISATLAIRGAGSFSIDQLIQKAITR